MNRKKILLQIYHQKKLHSSLEINGFSLSDSTWTPFKFVPIFSQKGDQFMLKITPINETKQILISLDQQHQPAFTTTFKKNIKDSFLFSVNYQKTHFLQQNPLFSGSYIGLLVLFNILLCLV